MYGGEKNFLRNTKFIGWLGRNRDIIKLNRE